MGNEAEVLPPINPSSPKDSMILDEDLEHDPGLGEEIDLSGIIFPPIDIRNIVDKTAAFVARNGPHFEDRIRENEKHNPKFCFLNHLDPYFAYYQYKIKEIKSGKTSSTAKEKEKEQEAKQQQQAEIPKAPPKEPPPFQFLVDIPNISAQDLDIVKLTALFVARNGRQFMNALLQREARNFQFDFLRPNHSLFPLFTKLTDQYTKVLAPSNELKEKLEKHGNDKYEIMKDVMVRVEFARYQEEKRKKAEEEADKERLAYASIDWHDFVVVETVEFTEADETIPLPPPITLQELENMSLTQKSFAMGSVQTVAQQEQDDMEMEDDVDMEEDDGPPPEPQAKIQEPPVHMKIKQNYIPKTKRPLAPEPTSLCPLCNQPIPVSEMQEHLRIELLDPKWREQKMAMEAKKKESNLAAGKLGSDVSRNLRNISERRSDIFGTEEVAIGQKVGEDMQRMKQIEKEKVIWDGHTASIGSATQRAHMGFSIEDQINAIHKSKGLTGEEETIAYGPRIPDKSGVSSVPFHPAYPSGYPEYYPPASGENYSMPPAGTMMDQSQYLSMHQQPLPPPPPTSMPISSTGVAILPSAFSSQSATESSMQELRGSEFESTVETPPGEGEPESKRQKLGENTIFIPEADFIAMQLDKEVIVTVQTPMMDKSEWKLNGQCITIPPMPLTATVFELKELIQKETGMPAPRQKLVITLHNGMPIVLKNQLSLGYYNLSKDSVVNLGLKGRGGKK